MHRGVPRVRVARSWRSEAFRAYSPPAPPGVAARAGARLRAALRLTSRHPAVPADDQRDDDGCAASALHALSEGTRAATRPRRRSRGGASHPRADAHRGPRCHAVVSATGGRQCSRGTRGASRGRAVSTKKRPVHSETRRSKRRAVTVDTVMPANDTKGSFVRRFPRLDGPHSRITG